MNSTTTYKTNPYIAWANEANNACVLIIPNMKQRIRFEGLEAILWRSIWQDLTPDMWEHDFLEAGKDIHKVQEDWHYKGWIIEVDI